MYVGAVLEGYHFFQESMSNEGWAETQAGRQWRVLGPGRNSSRGTCPPITDCEILFTLCNNRRFVTGPVGFSLLTHYFSYFLVARVMDECIFIRKS